MPRFNSETAKEKSVAVKIWSRAEQLTQKRATSKVAYSQMQQSTAANQRSVYL